MCRSRQRPWLLWVWVQLQAPKPDGLATNEEARALHEIGEALDALVSAICGAQLVGRITGNGRREFYFYAAEPGELTASVASAMKAFPEYKYETGSTFQPEWEQYLTLYPSETNLERMQNRPHARSAGGGGRRARSRRARSITGCTSPTSIARGLPRDAGGHRIRGRRRGPVGEEGRGNAFALVVSRVDSVDTHTINGITLELARLAGEYCARYDGWECPVTAGAPAVTS